MKVLVIDDDGMIRRATMRLLKGMGWEVIEALSPADLEGLFRENPGIDVVLSDLDMPDGGGERVLAESPKPVVLYSGNERGIERSGAERWLLKGSTTAEQIHAKLCEAVRP